VVVNWHVETVHETEERRLADHGKSTVSNANGEPVTVAQVL
jgi:hypothetical protein